MFIERLGAGGDDDGNRLPWGALKDHADFPDTVHISTNSKPGQFVLQTIFAEFSVQAERKIEQVLAASVSAGSCSFQCAKKRLSTR